LQEILLDNSDSIPEINSPYVKLAMILGISGISTYAANKNKEMAKESKKAQEQKHEESPQEQKTAVNEQKEKPSPYCGGSLTKSRAESGYGSVLVDISPPKKRPYTRKVPTKKQAEKMKALGISFEQLKQQEAAL